MILAAYAFTALTLADAERRTVDRDTGVAFAQATVVQNAANLHIARITAFPHLIGSYSLSPQAGSGTQSTSTVEQHLLGVGVGISLNDILANSDEVRAAANQLLASQRDADTAELLARERAVQLYYAALGAIALEQFRSSELVATQRDLSAARIRARSGESPQLDVMRANVAVDQAQADLVAASAQRVDAVEALASATGVPASKLSRVATSTAPPFIAPNVDTAVARALSLRPEIMSLLATINARRAVLGIARQTALPLVTANGGYQGGDDTGQPVRGPAVTVNLDLPIVSPAGAQAQIAEAQLDAAQSELVGEQRAISLQVAAAVRDARAADDTARAAEAARTVAVRALDAVEIGYREGAVSSLAVSDARRTFVQASVNALVADYAREQAHAIVEVLVP
jgi:outer membrane protein TolC